MNTDYNPQDIEKAVQHYWAEHHAFEVKEDLSREKFYCLTMLPYPSGDLHMGHVRNYTLGDVIARYEHMKGKNVLQPMGWDAFGLPAENAAIANQSPPAEWTRKNIKKMRKQLQALGLAYDWRREITTCEPDYYRWEQWLFVKLYQQGLIYRKNAWVNWDPVDQTVLANEQVVDGKGWRSGASIERREIPQWFFKTTDYADELLDGLDELDGWPEQVRTMQRNWIGRSEGVCIAFKIFKQKTYIDVFTTRPDTLMGVTYLSISPDHPVAIEAAKDHEELAKFQKKWKKMKVAEADIAVQKKEGIDTGLQVIHPITKKRIPIWVTNFVLGEYGTGAVMSVPAHDQRDFEFAQQYELPMQIVIEPPKSAHWNFNNAAYTDYGTLINSGEFDGLKGKKAIKTIIDTIGEKKLGQAQVHYRLRDWGISRQRYWGTPIPIIHCPHCGEVPVPEQDLPVILPEDLIPDGHGSPLKKSASFYKTQCPECGKAAKRDTDTMDTFVESSWYYARYCCNDQDKAMLDDRAKYWTPVDYYIGGIEHAVLHLLYARFMHKVLRDQGLVNSNEPFKNLLTQGMVLKDGAKMSKSKGNVVTPQPLIKKYGADTVRLFMMFASPPEQSLEWSDSGAEGSHRFLKKLWSFCQGIAPTIIEINQQMSESLSDIDSNTELQTARKQIHDHLEQAEHDMNRLQFNTVVSASMKILNVLTKINNNNETAGLLIHEGLGILLRLLAPITPHITHHLWSELEYGANILSGGCPRVNCRAQQSCNIDLVVQVNGKLRACISIPPCSPEDAIKTAALNDKKVKQYIADKEIKKIIVVPDRLINIVV